jgi:hypothetical protein
MVLLYLSSWLPFPGSTGSGMPVIDTNHTLLPSGIRDRAGFVEV